MGAVKSSWWGQSARSLPRVPTAAPLRHQTRQFSLTEGGVTTRKKVVSLETKKGSVFKELNQLITLP